MTADVVAGRFYRPQELWRLTHAPRSLIYEALERGDLRAIRRGSRWLIPGSAAIAWLTSAAEGGDVMTRNGAGEVTGPRPDAGSRA